MTAETDELKGWIAMELIARFVLCAAIGLAIGPLISHVLVPLVISALLSVIAH